MMAYSEFQGAYQSNDELVRENLALVKRIAYHLAAKLPSTFEIEDLMQAGMIGLLEAAGKFDSSKGASFATYAGIRIRGAMLDDVRKRDWTPRSVYQKHRQVLDAVREIETETGNSAEAPEIADRIGVTLSEYHEILRDASACQLFSLDETLDESTHFGREMPASHAATPEQALDSSQRRQCVSDAVLRLPERERMVLSLYYEQEMNLKEIGEVLGVSESRVCQIHGQALIRIRAVVEES
jgi:RNA polymerase sigma factor for flagellar operon FliA